MRTYQVHEFSKGSGTVKYVPCDGLGMVWMDVRQIEHRPGSIIMLGRNLLDPEKSGELVPVGVFTYDTLHNSVEIRQTAKRVAEIRIS